MLAFGTSIEGGLAISTIKVACSFIGKFESGDVDFRGVVNGLDVTIPFNLAFNVKFINFELYFSCEELINFFHANRMR